MSARHSPASAALARTAFADQPMRVHSPAPHAHGVRSLHRLVYRSLAFLHKKTWHTANLKNVEKVWAAEEEQKKEEQKLERWKKEREEERQQAELRALQDEMSKTKRETRVDFLYEQPQTNAQEYLLGKAVLEKPEESDVKKAPGLTLALALALALTLTLTLTLTPTLTLTLTLTLARWRCCPGVTSSTARTTCRMRSTRSSTSSTTTRSS